MKYLLDTNICIFYLRGQLNLDSIIEEKVRGNCFISEITVIELTFGAENSLIFIEAIKTIDKFIKNFILLPITNVIKLFVKEKTDLEKLISQ